MEAEYFTIREAANLLGVTPQSIYLALKNKRIEAEKVNKCYKITLSALRKYQMSKHDRSLSKDENGNFILNPKEGRFSPRQLATYFNVPYGRIYYLIERRKIKYSKYKAGYIILVEDFDKMKEIILGNQLVMRTRFDRLDLNGR